MLPGVPGGEEGGRAGGGGGEAHGAEVEDLGPLHQPGVHLLRGEGAVRPPDEAEGALTAGGDGDHRHSGGGGVGPRPGGVHAVFLQYAGEIAAEAVPAHLADEGGGGSQAGGGHRHVGGGAAGVGGEEGHVLRGDTGLGQVDEHLPDGGDIRHGKTASFL